VTVLTLAAGLVVPAAFAALTPGTAAAQGSDPLGPIIAQLEVTAATAVANVQSGLQPTIENLSLDIYGAFGLESGISCALELAQELGSSAIGGPCVDGGL
jgi:hypothetical protein